MIYLSEFILTIALSNPMGNKVVTSIISYIMQGISYKLVAKKRDSVKYNYYLCTELIRWA